MPEIVLETRFKAVNKTEDILAFGAYKKSGRHTIQYAKPVSKMRKMWLWA